LLETEIKANQEKWHLAETLSEELYRLLTEIRPPLGPDELAFELYNKVITGRKRASVVIWATDGPKTVMAKVEGLKTAVPRPLDDKTETLLAAMMLKVKEHCYNRTVAEYTVKELYVQTRCYEHIGLTNRGFIFLQGWPSELLDTNLRKFFGKTYEELKDDATQDIVVLYKGPAPGDLVMCARCKQQHAVHFDRMKQYKPGSHELDACCGNKGCCRIGEHL